ncbi:CBS-domain-containing protein [Sistotremastrum suecicum HHB10207 ss-3]|uniref:CBS-domain-containing protein n=1 Tax=Sistotremastrum suecicum HHB10207 ss-3 TaxID=1314776 RepID=A0A166INM7_9AGAM|nr:CBS-domain-containing protein [Sistotremastrum suecicum HHB10207 ss-3]
MSTLSGQSVPYAETRKKQTKRDEAIRKKIESELARKRTISTTHNIRNKKGGRAGAAKGTVAALKPSPALTVPDNITVSDASQLCAAKRTDCVLVVDEDEGLIGIFTAKDLAYRVTAEGLDPRNTPVSAIMTRNPMVTRDTTSATEALQLMVQRHFRHLPVCNEEGNVVGLLDITKVFHEALAKVERSSSASQMLYSALEGVQSELGPGLASNPQAAAMLAYVDALRDKTALPDLTSVMDARTTPATVGPKKTVLDAAKLMREHRTTAVCVMEGGAHVPGSPPRIAGIFTSKDVVLRVIAAGLDPARCSVVRVMTPHPDVASPSMTVQDALKKMHTGHYLNLPVIEEDGRLVAIVDVLKLTYATLEQMNAMTAGEGHTEGEGGPMWGRFFDSIGGHDDTESVMSGSHVRHDVHTPPPLANSSSLDALQKSPQSELAPGDSASVADADEASALADFPPLRRKAAGPESSVGDLRMAPAIPIDDGTYVFKFRTPSGRTHRFQARNDNYENLRDIVAGKLATDPFFTHVAAKKPDEPALDASDFSLAYTDLDGDTVVISADSDVVDAVKIARKGGADRVVLLIQGGRGWDEAGATEASAKAKDIAAASAREVREVEKTEISQSVPEPAAFAPPAKVHIPDDDKVYGVPKDLLLPASIGALAAVIVAVFAISRLARD